MKPIVREMYREEYPILEEFLYQAIYVPEGVDPPPRDIVDLPELQMYIAEFGEDEDDLCLVAVAGHHIMGAVWTRIMNDYGHVDEDTPSLSISVLREHRDLGIGTLLMEKMLALLKEKGYDRVSLSVQKANYAADMYKKLGFQVIRENREDLVMVYYF